MNLVQMTKQAVVAGMVVGTLMVHPLVALAQATPTAVQVAQSTAEESDTRPSGAYFVRVDNSTTTENTSDPEWRYVPVRRLK